MFERLTRIDAGGIITGAKRGRGEYVGTQEMLERLYEYENSNLSPEEVQSLAQAKADGRRLWETCKVGDNVYFLLKELEPMLCYSSPHRIQRSEHVDLDKCVSIRKNLKCNG